MSGEGRDVESGMRMARAAKSLAMPAAIAIAPGASAEGHAAAPPSVARQAAASLDGADEPVVRASWSSRLTFVLAAAGSAVGLGSIWKFPYITGVNGGGWFVLIYLICIALVAMPIMIAEILIGRSTQRSPVAAFRALARQSKGWTLLGWMAVAAAFLIMSYYSVVSGWTLHYTYLSVTGQLFESQGTAALKQVFTSVYTNPVLSLFWQFVFIALTFAVVAAGVQKGIERCCRYLFPFLLLVMLALLVQAVSGGGFRRGVDFVFGLRAGELTAAGVLDALGHSFFTLSLGMGALITYGSYLSHREDVVTSAAAVTGIDTIVSLLSCLTIFPIIFAFGLAPNEGPGLVFVSLPVAFGHMPGGQLWAALFFLLLAMAAVSSAISVFEVVVSHLCDEHRVKRWHACLSCGAAVIIAGIPAGLSGGTHLFGSDFQAMTAHAFGTGRNWFGLVDHITSNWLLPLTGLGVALFLSWRVGAEARERAFKSGTRFGKLYWGWVWALRYCAPPAVIAVFLHAVGLV